MKRNIISTARLAEICGVSQGTVDRALNGRKEISEKTKEKILRVAREYGYRPNLHARSMSGGRSMLIGIVVFDLENEYFADLVTEIERYASERGYYSIIMLTHKNKEAELKCIENLYYMAVDGIILCPVNCGEEYEGYLRSLDIPVITVGNRVGDIAYAGINNRLAMREVTEMARNNGYKRLFYLMPDIPEGENAYAQYERLKGFTDEAQGSGCLYKVKQGTMSTDGLDKEDAVICASDIFALRLLGEAQQKGFGISGFDNINIIDKIGLRLSSVFQDTEYVAGCAVDYIADGKKEIASATYKIIERGSL